MKLSKAQKCIVQGLKDGLYIWTDEGSNYKAWIGDRKGFKVRSINRRSVIALHRDGIIKLDDGLYRADWFRYTLR